MLVDASPSKRSVVEGTDIMVIRELTGGLYFGEPRGVEHFADGSARAVNTMAYTSREIERVARMGFEVARKRRKRLTSVDKANVLVVSQLWREVVTRVAKDYPDVTLDHVLVDNCAMALVHRPTQFDTIVTENTFGDILSDEAAILAGSMGMLPSASLGGSVGLYEPVHGTAPDIAGQGIANPIAAVLSAAMLMRYSLNMGREADRIDAAVSRVLEQGHRTRDIAEPAARDGRHARDGRPDRARAGGGDLMATGGQHRRRRRHRRGGTDDVAASSRSASSRCASCAASPPSARSARRSPSGREPVRVQRLEASAFRGVDIAFCSAGTVQSKEWAPQIVRGGRDRGRQIQRVADGPPRFHWWCRRSTPHAARRPRGHPGQPQLHHDRHRDAAQAAARRRAG